MKFTVSKPMLAKIKKMDENKKVRIFNRSLLEKKLDKVLAKRKELMELESLEDAFLTGTIRIDLTNGMKEVIPGKHYPAGDWFYFENTKGKWHLTACGRW